MFPVIDVSFDDYKAFTKQLDSLESDIRGKARYAGLTEMAKPLKKIIKSKLASHVQSGALYKSIGQRRIARSQYSSFDMEQGDAGLFVGAVNKQFHASVIKKRSQTYKMHFLEEGTVAHKIRAKRAKVLKFKGFSAKEVNHPGTRATHILKNSNAEMQGKYLDNFAIGAQRALKRHGVKLV